MNKNTWQRVKLGEVVEILSSKRIFYSEYVKSGIPFYRSKEIIDKALKKPLNECLYISCDKFDEIKERYGVPINGDILISAVGERSGIAYLVNNDGDFYFKDGNLIWLKNFSNNLNSKYLVYWFKSRVGQSILENIMIGSAQKALTIQGMKELLFDIPPIETQHKIAEILSSFDDKIDLLHRQNKTLESLALTLFRHYFINNPKRNEWEEKPLSAIAEIRIGRTPPRKEKQWFSTDSKNIKWISIKDMEEKIFIFNTSEFLVTEAINKFKIPIIPPKTIILSFKMTLGRVGITTEKMLSNEAIAHFNLYKEYKDFSEYLYLFLKIFKYEILGSTSSIVTAINASLIKNIQIPIPNKVLFNNFLVQAKDFFDKIYNNYKQIQNLESMRDIMLSKLLSGEVEV